MNLLLLSAYDAGSHRRWRTGLVEALAEHRWTVEALAPRHFLWRSRGNSLWWAWGRRDVLQAPFDAVVATSMTDLSALRGMLPALGHVPTLVYFHENQIAYPVRDGEVDVNPALTNLYTALCGDVVVFNSPFNRDSFLDGTEALLRRLPDYVPEGVIDRIRARSRILPVPLEERCFQARAAPPRGSLQILWNHRWEFDKAPDRFFSALFELDARGVDFRLHVAGERFRKAPPIFEEAHRRLRDRIDTWGFVADVEAYRRLLTTCDVVVSTALHEFQGLAVLEAVAAGCHPLVPDRLAYRDFIPEMNRYPSHPSAPDAERAHLVAALEAMAADVDGLRRRPVPDIRNLRWAQQASAYREALQDCVSTNNG